MKKSHAHGSLNKNRKVSRAKKQTTAAKSTSPAPATIQAAWTEMLNHVYHPARLKVLSPLLTITGKVTKTKQEPDGDLHIELDNRMECEIICCGKVTQADAVTACQNYKNKVTIPKVGNNVQVTGQHVYDTVHKHEEIHPVFQLKII